MFDIEKCREEGWIKWIDGKVRRLSIRKYKTILNQPHHKTAQTNLPRSIRFLIKCKPWLAAKEIEKFHQRRTIVANALNLDLETVTVGLNDGTQVSLKQALDPKLKDLQKTITDDLKLSEMDSRSPT